METFGKKPAESGIGRGFVGGWCVLALLAYKIATGGLILYCLLKLWPYPTPGMNLPPALMRDTTYVVTTDDTAAVRFAATIHRVLSENSANDIVSPLLARDYASAPPWLACRPDLVEYYRQLDDQEKSMTPKCVSVFGRTVAIWDEQRLLFIAMLAGALGTIVHTIRSLAVYIGNRRLVWSWVPYYLLLPVGGAALATVFYLAIRGGFFSPTSNVQETSPFGFAAMSAIVGMFSQAAILKLQKVAHTVFEEPPPAKDALVGAMATLPQPRIAKLDVRSSDGPEVSSLAIEGSGFTAESIVELNGKPHKVSFVDDKHLVVELTDSAFVKRPDLNRVQVQVITRKYRSNVMEIGSAS